MSVFSGRWDREAARLSRADPLWPAQLAVAGAIILHLTLSNRIVVGPPWLLPGVEGALLLALVVMTRRGAPLGIRTRGFALTVVGLVTLTNLVSFFLLAHYLINGGKTGGHKLILSGIVLWATNVLLFAVLYWELDRGGPSHRLPQLPAGQRMRPDFQFPQMENPQFAMEHWRPGFLDYLYTSLTNSTAFSPTDAMPLTKTAKCLMAVQGVAALAILGLVVARAVNILG